MNNGVKSHALGMAFGTASNRLRKALLFDAIGRLGERDCYRCGKSIDSVNEFSIEHKKSWMSSEDRVSSFFSLENISYSHLLCNVGAATRSNKSDTPQKTRDKIAQDRYWSKPENRERHNVGRRIGSHSTISVVRELVR